MYQKAIRISIAAIIFIIGFVIVASGAEFSADLVDTYGDESTINSFHFKDGKYRVEGEEDGEKFIAIVDMKSGMTSLISLTEQFYIQMESSETRGLVNNPFQGLESMKAMGESQSLGNETLNGYDCEKIKIVAQGQDIMTYWNATKLQFPIKIVMHYGGEMSTELKNIKEGGVNEALFVIPDGLTKYNSPDEIPQPIPDWAGDIASAPVKIPPFKVELKEGDIIRVKPVEGQSLWVRGKSPDGSDAIAKVIPFKNGRPIKEIAYCSSYPGQICVRREEMGIEIDEFVIRVFKGSASCEAKFYPMHEQTLKAGEQYKMSLDPANNIAVRFVNLSDGETTIRHDNLKGGVSANQGPEEYLTTTLKYRGEVYNMTWQPKGDELIIKVEKGSARIKLGQYDSFKF